MKTFIDRMHPMLTYDREHCLPTKDLILVTAYRAMDPYGVDLAVKMFESITGWAGMGFHTIRFHSENGSVHDDDETLRSAHDLGLSYRNWRKPELTVRCLHEKCGFTFRSAEDAAKHMVMAAGGPHLEWKSKNLSGIHTLQNTHKLTTEVLELLRQQET